MPHLHLSTLLSGADSFWQAKDSQSSPTLPTGNWRKEANISSQEITQHWLPSMWEIISILLTQGSKLLELTLIVHVSKLHLFQKLLLNLWLRAMLWLMEEDFGTLGSIEISILLVKSFTKMVTSLLPNFGDQTDLLLKFPIWLFTWSQRETNLNPILNLNWDLSWAQKFIRMSFNMLWKKLDKFSINTIKDWSILFLRIHKSILKRSLILICVFLILNQALTVDWMEISSVPQDSTTYSLLSMQFWLFPRQRTQELSSTWQFYSTMRNVVQTPPRAQDPQS